MYLQTRRPRPPKPDESLGRLVHSVLEKARLDAVRQAAAGHRIDLRKWVEALQQASIPIIGAVVVQARRAKARELLREIMRQGRRKSLNIRGVVKTQNVGMGTLDFSFDLYRPEISEFVRTATYQFAESTLATASMQAEKAIEAVREILATGLPRGDTYRVINREMVKIFSDPLKAARIGQTETQRAVNAGAYQVEQASAIVTGVQWLASSDACEEICLPLNGQVRKLGEPFFINAKAKGPYRICLHPPAHPFCMCSTMSVIDTSIIDARSIEMLTREANMR